MVCPRFSIGRARAATLKSQDPNGTVDIECGSTTFGMAANAKNPADWLITGQALQVEPYALMLRKDDPSFKAAVDGTIKRLIATGDFEKLYQKWFLAPIPPRNIPLNVPMSEELRRNLKDHSDKPAA